jgi:hypothetical protein
MTESQLTNEQCFDVSSAAVLEQVAGLMQMKFPTLKPVRSADGQSFRAAGPEGGPPACVRSAGASPTPATWPWSSSWCERRGTSRSAPPGSATSWPP